MRIAIIADIHANRVALDAVLADIAALQPKQIVCLGDVAATGPQPRQVVERLRALACPVVMGNADAWLLDPLPSEADDEDTRRVEAIDRWCAEQLAPADLAYLRTFQPTVELPLGTGATLLCCHGSPLSNTGIIRATTPDDELERMLGGQRATVLAGGHTHTQMLRRHRDMIVLNPGSVGLPFEQNPATGGTRNPPWAEYGIVDWADGKLSIELRRVPFEVAEIVRAARAGDMPHAQWWASDWDTA
jgi:predicted phosphodiesterase